MQVQDPAQRNRDWSDDVSYTSWADSRLMGWRRMSHNQEVRLPRGDDARGGEAIGVGSEAHCEMVLKRAKVESMRNEINKLSLEETHLSGFQDPRDRGRLAVQARRREMSKVPGRPSILRCFAPICITLSDSWW